MNENHLFNEQKHSNILNFKSMNLFFKLCPKVWHDRKELNIDAWEDRDGIGAMAQSVEKLVSSVGVLTHPLKRWQRWLK